MKKLEGKRLFLYYRERYRTFRRSYHNCFRKIDHAKQDIAWLMRLFPNPEKQVKDKILSLQSDIRFSMSIRKYITGQLRKYKLLIQKAKKSYELTLIKEREYQQN